MIVRAIRNTVLKWLLYAALFIALLTAINFGLSFVPFTPQWNAKRAEARGERLEAQVSTLQAEATGNAEIGQAVETYHTRETIIREGTAQAIAEARSAPDATIPLTPERAARLRAADRVLCDHTGLCPALSDPTGGGAEAVRDSDPAR